MVLPFAAVDVVLRRLFTALQFYFQCFGLHYTALLFAWDCCCPHEHFCSSSFFLHFDYFCFLVNLHRSDQSNPWGNVTNCSFRFIHSILVMFFFSEGLTLCEYSVWCCSKSLFRFIMWISLEWFCREYRSNLILLFFLRVHSTFTIGTLDVLCSPLGLSQRGLNPLMKNNPMFLLRGAFSMKLLLLSDSIGQKVLCWCSHLLHESWLELDSWN